MISGNFYISKSFKFHYSHRLNHLTCGHACSSLHGHTGKITVKLETPCLNADGFIVDFNELKVLKTWIDMNWDHSTIVHSEDKSLLSFLIKNNQKYFKCDCLATSENLANLFLNTVVLPNIKNWIDTTIPYKVTVEFSETENNIAGVVYSYTPS